MRNQLLTLLLVTLTWAGHCPAAEKEAGQWVVVTAPAFRPALAPLIEHRRAEGFQVRVVETTNLLTAGQIRETNALSLQARLSRWCREYPGPSYVLLVGAVAAADPAAAEQTVVPPLLGTTGVMRGEPSDHAYGSLDSNGAPTVAVGRFPARTVEEVRGMVDKTLRFEQERSPAPWRNRLVLLGGNPGGGPLAGMIYDMIAQPRIKRLDPSWNVRAMFHSSQSIYYLPGARLQEAATRFLEEGELFSFYLGHSDPSGLASGTNRFLRREDWAGLKIGSGPGAFFTTGCSSCRLGGAGGEGYGLAAMRNPNGPAGVIGAHRDSYSAPGLLALDGMVGCLATPPFPPRLADYWLAITAGLARGEMSESTFKLLDLADGSGGKTPLAFQRLEHLEMWMLLGDPALRLPLVPLDIRLEVPETVAAGQRVAVHGVVPERLADATIRVTLERPAGSKPLYREKLPERGDQNRERVASENNQRVNNVVLAATEAKPNGKRFDCSLELPGQVPWSNVVVRAWATTKTEAALGVATVPVRVESKTPAPGSTTAQ